jgi:hypothetical protein
MRKKWWLLAIPPLLCGSIFWARDAAWKKQEERFHVAAKSWLKIGAADTTVYPNSLRPYENNSIIYYDESADSLLQIDRMKLSVSQSPRPRNKPLIFISMSSGGSVGEPFGFYLSKAEDRGWIEIPEPDMDSWKNYELASETCRALKQRIGELEKKGGTLAESK